MPQHILERTLSDDPANFVQLPYWGAEFVGAGPFKLRDWELGSRMVLVANDDYVLGRPKIDEIEVRFIGDANAVIANILAVELQYTIDGRTHTVEDSLTVRQQWNDGHFELGSGAVMSVFPQFRDVRPAVIADVRFRKALLHAMDRQEMVDTIQGGQAAVAESHLGPDNMEWQYVEQ